MNPGERKAWQHMLASQAKTFQHNTPFIVRDMWGRQPKRIFHVYYDPHDQFFVLAVYGDSFEDCRVFVSEISAEHLVKVYCDDYLYKHVEDSKTHATWIDRHEPIEFIVTDPDFPNAERLFEEDE